MSTGSDSNLPHKTLFKKVIFFDFRNMKNFYQKKKKKTKTKTNLAEAPWTTSIAGNRASDSHSCKLDSISACVHNNV
jgi:hypothetical protein